MTTPATEPAQNDAGANSDPDETQGDPADLGDAGKNAIKAEREARKSAERQMAALQTQLDEIEKSKLSDLERAQATATEYQTAAAQAKAEALRWRTAAKHGISDEDAETFLTGSDEETLTRQAQRLASLASSTAQASPRPDLSQSATRAPGAGSDPGQDFARFLSTQIGR